MTGKPAFWALSAAVLLLPVASAADISISSEDPVMLAAEGSGTIDYDVSVDCIEFIEAQSASLTVPVTLSTAPEWLSSEAQSHTFNGQDCLLGLAGGTTLTQSGSLPINASAAAPGMMPAEAVVDADGATASIMVQVDYKPGYEFVYDAAAFPMAVGSSPETFAATIHLFANARSMAMWEILERPEFVAVSGIPDFHTVQDDQLAGDQEVMVDLTITVTPPSGDWTEDKIVFKTWSHFLDDGELKTDDETIEWTFTNAGATDDGESEGSPGFGAGALALALMGAALVALRRRQ